MKIILATHNRDKEKELQISLKGMNIEVLSLFDFPEIGDIEETGTTLLENSLLKSRLVFRKTGIPTIADDTGLEVDFLDGAPGVYSARYAGLHCSADDNINKVLHKLSGEKNRLANFKTVIALIIDGKEECFEGICKGKITFSKYGEQGFGYDPIFKPAGFGKTFAEMSKLEKGVISHRGRATKNLVEFLKKN